MEEAVRGGQGQVSGALHVPRSRRLRRDLRPRRSFGLQPPPLPHPRARRVAENDHSADSATARAVVVSVRGLHVAWCSASSL
jgi:hypothetical protein